MKTFTHFLILFAALILGASKAEPAYEAVQIGPQYWMQENLNVVKFRNGDAIIEAKSIADWVKAGAAKQPAWCYFINDTTNTQKYGKLYNWYAVNDPRGLAPEGWHIPTNNEWTKFIDFLGGDRVASESMKTRFGWKENGNGNNAIDFRALPSGSRYADGSFSTLETHAYWWSITNDGNSHAWARGIGYANNFVKVESFYKKCGFSVRCVKD